MMEARALETETSASAVTALRAVVSWNGPDQPVLLTIYGPAGEAVALPLLQA